MTTVYDIYQAIDRLAPFSYAESWDNCGLMLGDKTMEVKRALFCLDVTEEIVAEAVAQQASLIITHHPVIFHPLKTVDSNTNVYRLIVGGVAVISAHTNLDIAEGFVNDVLAEKLGLEEITHLERIDGKGADISLGRMGILPKAVSIEAFAQQVKIALNCEKIDFVGGQPMVQRVAVCGGSGGSLLRTAVEKGADVLVTGDVRHDEFLLAHELGMGIIDGGHYHTEQPVLEVLSQRLQEIFPWVTFVRTKEDTVVKTV